MLSSARTLQKCVYRQGTIRCVTTASQAASEACITTKSYEEIPGPRPLPFVGNMLRIMTGQYDFSDFVKLQHRLHSEFGDLVRFSGFLGRNDLLFVYDPDDVARVHQNAGPWPERPPLHALQYYRQVLRKDIFKGSSGVLIDQGEGWQQARSQVNPVMMKTRAVQLYTSRIDQVAEDFVKKFPEWLQKSNQMPDDFANETHKWALESIALIALDTRLGCLEPNLAPDSEPQRMIEAVHTMFYTLQQLEFKAQIWRYVTTPTLKRFIKVTDYFVDVCMKYISQTMDRVKSKAMEDDEASVLERFLQRDPNKVRAVIMALDMLFAGIDTTSYTAVNALLHLSKNQEVQEKVYDELRSVMPDPQAPVTTEALEQLKYLRACIRESMRIEPIVVSVVRTTTSEIVLSNYRIPKNVDVILSHGKMSRMDKNFSQPEKFMPERWIRNEAVTKPNAFVSMPFGHGARKCVGMRFAALEMEILLSKMLRRYRWEWNQPDMKYTTTLVHRPVDPLRFTVTPRQK